MKKKQQSNSYTFSIIIPHKDIPNYLVRCLNSIPERNDVQVIVVDDNSKEANTYIEKFPELSRPNVELYFTNEGKGAGYARNVGLEHAKGEWILFADSDDYYYTDRLNALFTVAHSITADVVVYGVKFKTTSYVNNFDFEENRDTISIINNYESVLRNVVPWGKMIRHSLIKSNGIQFEEVITSNDIMFHLKLMSCLPKENIVQFNSNVYFWDCRKGSLTNVINIKSELCRLNVAIRACQFTRKQGWGYFNATFLYLYRVKQLSTKLFWAYFLKECLMLGVTKAIADYAYACDQESKRLPFIIRLLWIIASKYKSFQRKIANKKIGSL